MAAGKPRFLVLRGGAIGDFIVTLPVLAALRERWPEAHLEVVGYPHVANLALVAGLVDAVRSLDAAHIARFFSWRPVFPDEQQAYIRSFDMVFLFLNDPEGTVRGNLQDAGARQVVYGSPIVTAGHAVDHLLRPLESLAIYAQGAVPALRWPEERRAAGRQMLERWNLARRALAMHPGSGSQAKNWPPARFAAVARRAAAEGFAPFFLMGEAEVERKTDAALAASAPGVTQVVGLELDEVASLLSACDLYLGHDSGITHLAAALGLPTVALFGPSDPERWAPRGPNVRVICGEHRDIGAIGEEQVWDALRSL